MNSNKTIEEKVEGLDNLDLIWDLKLEVELLHRYLHDIFQKQESGDISKVRDWDLNGSIKHIKKLNSQNKDIKSLKSVLLDEQDRRKSLGIWDGRNS